MERKSLSKKIRFEVFKRDSFQCQYCGRKAPEILLEIDHIEPVSKGGTNDILNLITSCMDCNRGKSNKRLSDNSVIKKQNQQLAELQKRQEQIEMMMKWQKGLLQIDDTIINQLCKYWEKLTDSYSLNKNGIKGLKKLIKQFEITIIMKAMKIAADTYLEYKDEYPTQESVEKTWNYVGRICTVEKKSINDPNIKDLYYIKGILRNRFSYIKEYVAIDALKKGLDNGYSIEELKNYSLIATSWLKWKEGMSQSFGVLLII